jgi:hypothetical protein
MEKLTVSMTSMGTEISDLKTHSEANAKAAAIGPMSEEELDTFLTDRCLPKFMDRMIAKQNEANTAVTKHQQEMLEQSAKTVIADVVKEQLQLHLSYLTAEQNLITTFRKCLEEAVREMKKVAEAVEPIDPKQGDREEITTARSPQNLSPPSQEFPSLYRGWREEESKGADRTLGSALQELQPEQQENEGGGDTLVGTPEVHPTTITFRTGTLGGEVMGETQGVEDVKRVIFEVEGELSNLTAPQFATGTGEEDGKLDESENCSKQPMEEHVENMAAEQECIQNDEVADETDQRISVEGCAVDEAAPPAAPVKRYNTRNRAPRPDASDVTPTNLNANATEASSEVESSVRGRSEQVEEMQGTQKKRISSKGKKEKDLTGGHGNITHFFDPK